MVIDNDFIRPFGWSSVSDKAPAKAPKASVTPKNGRPAIINGTANTPIEIVARKANKR